VVRLKEGWKIGYEGRPSELLGGEVKDLRWAKKKSILTPHHLPNSSTLYAYDYREVVEVEKYLLNQDTKEAT